MQPVKLFMPEMQADASAKETLVESQAMLKRVEAKWSSGSVSTPQEIVKLNRERKELKRKIQALE
jgi:hypothetical protein